VPIGPNTKFVFTGASVNPAAVIHIGMLVRTSVLKIKGVFWTSNGTSIGCAPQCNSLYGTHDFGGSNGKVTYQNDANDCNAVTRYVLPLSFEYYSDPPALSSLVSNGIALGLRSPMYVENVPVGPSITLGVGQEVSLSLAPPLSTARYVVLLHHVGLTPALPDSGSTLDFVLVPILPEPPSCPLVFSSPFGPGSLQMDNAPCAGVAGQIYFTAITLAPGNFPNGWYFGLDIPLPELVNQFVTGYPFVGTLDAAGASTFGPIVGVPSGLQLWAVTAHYSPAFATLGSRVPVTYLVP
jgi:hypothetical protein